MKRVWMLFVCICASVAAGAQGLGQIFNQKGTEKKYTIEQIAQLEVYLQLVKKGYTVAKKGLAFIGDIKRGDWDLHSEYFTSLKKVNPHIAGYAKVAAIMLLAKQVIAISRVDKAQVTGSKFYSAGERSYVDAMYEQLTEDLDEDLAFLTALVSDGKYSMKDDERMEHIDQMYAAMKNRFVFARVFSENHSASLAARAQGASDMETMKQLYNVK